MAASVQAGSTIPWWKEPTREQWHAWIAAWLGWTLDSFDFTIFLLIMLPISQEFDVPLTAVTAVFTVTLWRRLAGATAASWMECPHGLSVDWRGVWRLLLDLGAVLDLSAKGIAVDAADGRDAGVLGEHRRVRRQRTVGRHREVRATASGF